MREGEEHFRQLFENAADSLILHDGDRVREVNQEAFHSLGYTREELLRMSLSDIEVGYKQDRFTGLEENDGRAITFSGSFRRQDGSTFPADVRVGEVTLEGKKLRLAAIRDITKRQQAEEALQAERQRLFSLLDGLQAYIYLRRPDYSLVYVNQYFRERFGDPANLPCFKILHNRREPCKGCPSDKVFETGEPQEWEWTSKSGRTYRIYDYPFADVDGAPLVLEMGMDITQYKQAEEGLRASEEALRRNEERYRALAGHLLTAQEAERKRLARELHDDLSQRLAALAMEAEILERQTPPTLKADSVRPKEVKDKLVELSIDVHAMSRRLHPSILDDLGLADAVASECAMFRKQDGIVVNFRAENISREVHPNVPVCLYRIVQEGLRNISRHAEATEVSISLVGEDQAIRLSIKDNGKGFDPGWKTSQGGFRLRQYEGAGLFNRRGFFGDVPTRAGDGDRGLGALIQESRMRRIRVLLADDHKIVLDGLRSLLEPTFDLVGMVEDGRALVSAVEQLRPDVIVVDISMPLLNGIEAVRQIKKLDSQVKVVFLTMHPDVTYAIRAFEAGASGFVLKHSASSELLTAIQEAIKGRTYVTPMIAGELVQAYQGGTYRQVEEAQQLTPRQREILQLLVEGRAAKEIAGLLNISPRTVEFHKYNLMAKLNLKTVSALIQYAIKHGFTTLEG